MDGRGGGDQSTVNCTTAQYIGVTEASLIALLSSPLPYTLQGGSTELNTGN